MAVVGNQRQTPVQYLDDLGTESKNFDLPVPPSDHYAEQVLLGAILSDNSQLEYVSYLQPGDFYAQPHKIIYKAMLKLVGEHKAVDTATVKNLLERTGEFDAIGGLRYLAELVYQTPQNMNTSEYAKLVREKSRLRALLLSTKEIQKMVYQQDDTPTEVLLGQAQQRILEIGQDDIHNRGPVKISSPANDALERIEELHSSGVHTTGVSSGFIDLDSITSGFQRADLIVIAGRPSMGKTALAMNIAEHCAVQHERIVVVFSLEMSEIQLATRSIASLSSINSKFLRDGRLGEGPEKDQNWARISQAIEILNKAPIFVDSTNIVSPLDISARCRRLKREEGGLDLVIVDYLQMLQMKDNDANRSTELSNITRELKLLAKELDVPVIALSQLNRGVESRVSKKPLMADLRDSGAIEQDADMIMFVYRDQFYNKETEDFGTAEIIIAKHRNGEIGTVKLTFIEEYTRFENHADSSMDDSSVPLA